MPDEYVPEYIDVTIDESDDACSIRLTGEIDVLVAPELRKLLIASLEKGRVILDMGGVTFIDSSGLGALVAARMTVTPEDTEHFVVRNVPANIRSTFEIAGVAHLLGEE